MAKEMNNEDLLNDKNVIIRIRMSRKTYLAVKLYLEDLTSAYAVMEFVCREFLMNRNPQIIDFLDDINPEE